MSWAVRCHLDKIVGRVFIAPLVLSLALGIAVVRAEARNPRWVSDQLLVRSTPAHRGAALAALASEGAVAENELALLGVSIVRVPAERRAAVQRRLRASRLFRSVERNYLVEAEEIPNDTLYPAEWALPRLQAPLAWDLTRGRG